MEFTDIKTVSARDLYREMGYTEWRNFRLLIAKAESLIKQGVGGTISRTSAPVSIGSGAIRHLEDFALDAQAVKLLTRLSGRTKLTGLGAIRNETAVLALLRKYYVARDLRFVFQYPLGGFRFDAFIGGSVLVEFDEHHHVSSLRQRHTDAKKDGMAKEQGLEIVRLTIEDDVVDAILLIDRALGL